MDDGCGRSRSGAADLLRVQGHRRTSTCPNSSLESGGEKGIDENLKLCVLVCLCVCVCAESFCKLCLQGHSSSSASYYYSYYLFIFKKMFSGTPLH